jgi:hypothetical protein
MQCHPRKLLNQVRHVIRLKHYSMSTEDAYVSWIKRYILFHDKRHPEEMGVGDRVFCGCLVLWWSARICCVAASHLTVFNHRLAATESRLIRRWSNVF